MFFKVAFDLMRGKRPIDIVKQAVIMATTNTTEEIADRLVENLIEAMREAHSKVPAAMLDGPDANEGYAELVLYFVLEASKRGVSIVGKESHDLTIRRIATLERARNGR
jgi:hypothetical protein